MTERGLKNINVFYSTFTNVFFIFVTFFKRFFIFIFWNVFTSMENIAPELRWTQRRVQATWTDLNGRCAGPQGSHISDAGNSAISL